MTFAAACSLLGGYLPFLCRTLRSAVGRSGIQKQSCMVTITIRPSSTDQLEMCANFVCLVNGEIGRDSKRKVLKSMSNPLLQFQNLVMIQISDITILF